jgi:hypothetical protein
MLGMPKLLDRAGFLGAAAAVIAAVGNDLTCEKRACAGVEWLDAGSCDRSHES